MGDRLNEVSVVFEYFQRGTVPQSNMRVKYTSVHARPFCFAKPYILVTPSRCWKVFEMVDEEKDVTQVKVRMLDEGKEVVETVQVKVPIEKIRAIREVNPDFYKLIPAKDIAIIALNQLLYDEKHRKKRGP